MKKLSFLLISLVLALCFGVTQSFAQIEVREFITIEITNTKLNLKCDVKIVASHKTENK